MEKRRKRMNFKRVLALVIAVCTILALPIGVSAETVSDEVLNARNSVVRLQTSKYVFTDNTGKTYDDVIMNYNGIYNTIGLGEPVAFIGTGFLVGTDDSSLDTIITASHVSGESWLENVVVGVTKDNKYITRTGWCVATEYSAIIGRDYKVPCEVDGNSSQSEFAILKLTEGKKFANRTGATLNVKGPIEVGSAIHVLGFPGDITNNLLQAEFEPKDVVVTSGNVNRYGDELMNYGDSKAGSYSMPCYTHDAVSTGGNSGGPVVDENGVVVGILISGRGERNFAADIDMVVTILDSLGIPYKTNDGSKSDDDKDKNKEDPVLPTLDTSKLSSLLKKANDVDATEYTEESYAALKEAIQEANDALTSDSQEDINAAADDLDDAIQGLEVKKTKQFVLIGVIAAVAAIIIAVVVVLIVLAKKKKQPASAAPVAPAVPAAPAPAVSAPTPAPAPVQVSNETSVLNQGAGETSVLSQGAGETTVLSQQVNGGLLTRTSNNERIPVNSAEFTIGRERNKVDYCVGGNTNISRIHARFVVREGKTYIVDNKAANGTFVNGIKARPGQEIELKSGDKIVLADEKFEFTK